jgi:hypothetical protein
MIAVFCAAVLMLTLSPWTACGAGAGRAGGAVLGFAAGAGGGAVAVEPCTDKLMVNPSIGFIG